MSCFDCYLPVADVVTDDLRVALLISCTQKAEVDSRLEDLQKRLVRIENCLTSMQPTSFLTPPRSLTSTSASTSETPEQPSDITDVYNNKLNDLDQFQEFEDRLKADPNKIAEIVSNRNDKIPIA